MVILYLFDELDALDGQEVIAARKPTGMFGPRIVLGLPIAQSSVTAETFDVVTSFYRNRKAVNRVLRTLDV